MVAAMMTIRMVAIVSEEPDGDGLYPAVLECGHSVQLDRAEREVAYCAGCSRRPILAQLARDELSGRTTMPCGPQEPGATWAVHRRGRHVATYAARDAMDALDRYAASQGLGSHLYACRHVEYYGRTVVAMEIE